MNTRNYKHGQRPRAMSQIRTAPHRATRAQSYLKIAGLFVCAIVVLSVGRTVLAASNTHSKEDVAAQTVQEPPKRMVDTSTLAASISTITKQYPYNTSVAVVDLNSGTLIQSGDTYPFIAASTTKLLTALVYLTDVESGKASLDDSIDGKSAKTELQLMINESDNTAWKELNKELTKARLVEYAKKHEVTSFDATDNKITSSDMAKLISKLYKRELINDEHTKLLLSWMQNTSEERFIPSAVPDSMTSYHKAGYLADRVHDVAIIDNGSAPFALVIYSKSYTSSYDYTVGQKMYKQITQQVITTFQ